MIGRIGFLVRLRSSTVAMAWPRRLIDW